MAAKTQQKHTLSKSTYVRGCKCLKSLYFYKHHYDLKAEVSDAQQAVFDQGHEIGKLAQSLFPGGTDCSVEPAWDYAAATAGTEKALSNKATVLYEGAFMYNNVFAALDILVIKRNGWYVYEVKSTTSVKEYHYTDASIQWYILKALGFPVKAMHIIHLNGNYERKKEIDPQRLFTIVDITANVVAEQVNIYERLPVMFNTLKAETIPNIQIGPQCGMYYGCDFEHVCWKSIHEQTFPVTEISRINQDKLWKLIESGVYCQTQIPDDFKLSPNQHMQVVANKTQTSPLPDTDAIADFLYDITFPIGFLDFETFSTAIPLFYNTRPYQQVPFQFSIHILDAEMQLKHYAYLGDGKSDPREALIVQMIEILKNTRSILCYNMNFESKRIQELAAAFPAYAKALWEIEDKLIDLIVPFRNRYVYHHKMNGSASIKQVLPALVPELNYDDLEIKEGGTASQQYLNLYNETDEAVVDQIRTGLLAYCEMDTYAMVVLYRYLKQLAETN